MCENDLGFSVFRRRTLFFLLILGFIPCIAQNNASTPLPAIEELVEDMAEQMQQENTDNTSFEDELLFFLEHPINLNCAKKEELQALHLLTAIQIDHLLTHIANNGDLLLIYELQAIDGFDLQVIQKLLPYVYVSDRTAVSSFSKNKLLRGEHAFLLRYAQVLEQQAGFTSIDSVSLYKNPNARYIGSPQKILASYRYAVGKTIRFGFTAEKDQGELLFKKNQQFNKQWYDPTVQKKLHTGFDFYSTHLFIQDIKNIQALALGDYTVSFGQGLTAWSGLSLGKSSEILYAKKSASGIRPSTSADESRFMRGIATAISLKKMIVTFFYSRKKADASIRDTLEDGSPASISSLQQTGIHSTPSEIAGKRIATQTVYGGNILYSRKHLNLGITFIQHRLDLPIQPTTSAYHQFEISSDRQTFHAGLDYQFLLRNFLFFGETSRGDNGAMAFLNGLFISLDPRLSFTALHRYYDRTYQNKLSNPFGESGSSNEKGIYMGISANISRSVAVNACYDRFEFPWLRYLVDAPSKGNDLHGQFNYTPSKKLNFTFRIRQRNKEKNSKATLSVPSLTIHRSENYRLHLDYSLARTLKLRSRIEWIQYKSEMAMQTGYLLYQDILYKNPTKSFTATLRYALFQTDGYDSRLYEYENDVTGSYSIPSFYDRGSRFYVLFNYSLTKHVELWLRYAQTFYDNKEVIGEGLLTEIQGNTKSEVKLQVKVKW